MAKPYALTHEPVRWWMVSSILALVVVLLPIPAWIVEDFYSRDMYPWLQGFVTNASNLLPLAVLDLLLFVVVFLGLFRMRRLYYVARQRGLIDAVWEAVRRVVRAVAIFTVLFYWVWGFNYRRVPLAEAALPGPPPQLTVDMLQAGFGDAAALASRLRPMVQNDVGNLHTIRLELQDPMNSALMALGRPALTTPGQPKLSLVLSPFFRWAGVTGMVNPFGLESILLPDLLPFERPFVLAHEWAHLAGHADEAEASAVGWLACMHGSAVLGYSGSIYLLTETSHAMPLAEREKAMARLDAGVRSDLEAIALRMRDEKPKVRETTNRIYDNYLRANRVSDGTASYGRALTLILSSPFREALSTYTLAR